MPQTIADGLQGIINAKSDIDGAVKAKGGIVTKGLVNSDDDIMTIKNAVTSIDISENGTYYIGEETVVTSSTFPVEIDDSNGTPLRHVDINGNTVQNGTPTSSNPIMPQGTGDRTENLFDESAFYSSITGVTQQGTFSISGGTLTVSSGNENVAYTIPFQASDASYRLYVQPNTTYYVNFENSENSRLLLFKNGLASAAISLTQPGTINTDSDTDFYTFRFGTISTVTSPVEIWIKNIMLNVGSTAKPYEPYGYKIGISSGVVTTNTYLGNVQTTRKIKKLVFDGTENNWRITGTGRMGIPLSDLPQRLTNPYCSHFIGTNAETYPNVGNGECSISVVNGSVREFGCYVSTITTLADFKTWLQQQYANGTPVTIWYVLVTAETAAVNEPLMKIGDYADTLSVDVELPLSQNTKNNIDVNTTLKPSSASFTYDKISEYIGYDEINVDVSNTYTAEDEGKVVSQGNLIAQTAMPDEITENDTIDTTFYNSVTVNVPTGVDPEPINAVLEDANDELEAALGGGGSTPVAKGQVNFYDYDGTLIKSMSSAQFRGLESMPENPSHEGLTAQGWNWSLSDAKAYVAAYGSLHIGQQYVTNDGKTRIYINLPEGRISPVLQLYLNANTELDIDWGDGSTHSTWTTTSADYKSERHSYPDKGKYVIAITVVNGSFIIQSQSASYNTFFTDGKNSNNSSDRAYLNSIQKIEIGTGVTSIESLAFYNCVSLSSITIPNSVTTIGIYAFYNCYSLSSITIPDSVTSIQGQTFYNCYDLSSITIPDSVTTIGNNAFQYCYSLSSITIPDSVTTIGNSVFQYCSALSSITIPNSVTTIGQSVFSGCTALSSITISDSVTSIGNNAFQYCYSLYSITIPDSVTTIGQSVFQYCSALSSITIPNGVTSIGSSAFYNCYSLSSITIPDSVTSIGGGVFSNCFALSSVTIPDDVTKIESVAFFCCYSLSSITIPDGVTIIQSNAFNSCNSMDYIRFIGTTPPTVQNSNAWSDVSTSTILYVPALVSNLYMNGTNYPAKATYTYLGYATYTSGETLPSTTTDETYTLTWYATSADAIAQTNPITQGTGTEVYSRATPVA